MPLSPSVAAPTRRATPLTGQRHAQARGKVRRNVASLVILPVGQEGPRPGP